MVMETAQIVLLGAIIVVLAALLVVRSRRRDSALESYEHMLAEAVSDGVLSQAELEELAALQRKGALSSTDVRAAGIAIYRDALEAAAADSRLTPEEDAALRRLQQQLGLTESDLAADLTQVARLRTLARIEEGNFPDVRSPIQLVPDERCYWAVQTTLAERLAVGATRHELKGITSNVGSSLSFDDDRELDALRPADDILPSDLGVLVITSRRTVFQGARKTVSVPHARLASVTLYDDGIRIDELKPPARRYFLTEDPELTAAILLAAARRRRQEIKPGSPERSA